MDMAISVQTAQSNVLMDGVIVHNRVVDDDDDADYIMLLLRIITFYYFTSYLYLYEHGNVKCK